MPVNSAASLLMDQPRVGVLGETGRQRPISRPIAARHQGVAEAGVTRGVTVA